MAENDIPEHIAIIMDGNGRWAKNRGLPRRDGHRAGAESVREAVETCRDLGVKYLTLYAFSSENWNRPKTEIDALMLLLDRFLSEKTSELNKQNVRLHTIGQIERLPEKTNVDSQRPRKRQPTILTSISFLLFPMEDAKRLPEQ